MLKNKDSPGRLIRIKYLLFTIRPDICLSLRCKCKCNSLTHGIFLGPGPSSSLILGFICLVNVSNLRHQRIIWIRICQQGADRQKNLGYCKGRAPLLFEDVKTDASIAVDIWVENLRTEGNLRWFKRVIGREVKRYKENTTSKWAVSRAHNRCLPVKHVISNRTSAA
uniref:Uncharacterized protein MANES_05G205200 n=1 Tax=Rhizophora mucronata TaxID=61149 RepID=A0A2P2LWB3_RHIMU